MFSKRVVVLCGPTGVGKTDVSLNLARYFQAEIINADASQLRRDLNIGTAKISPLAMDGIPHHLFDLIGPTEEYSIKAYQDSVRPLLDSIPRPFLVGGSGLYIKAALTDYPLLSPKRSEDLYPELDNEALYKVLQELNPQSALKTHPNNRRRVLRYLDLSRNDCFPKEAKPLYEVLYLLLVRPREILYERINKRVNLMLAGGWLEEVKALKEAGLDFNKISEIGYQELNNYLDGKISYEDCYALIKQKTRHYAKRQLTWFRGQTPAREIDLEETKIEDIIALIKAFYEEG